MKLTRLREWRQKRGLNQTELGEKAGVWAQTISGLEQQKQEARPSTARHLAEALNVGIEDLIDPDGDVRALKEDNDPPAEQSAKPTGEGPLFFELGRLLKEAERSGGPEAQMEVLELLVEQSPPGWRKELYKLYHAEQQFRAGLRENRASLPKHTAAVVTAYARVLRHLVEGRGGEEPSRATLEDARRVLEAGRGSWRTAEKT